MTPALPAHLAALALVGADVVVRGLRIRLLVPGGQRLSLWQAITVNAYGEAAAAVTPGRIGGDPARFLGFRRAGIDTPRALAGLGVEALIDWVLLATAAAALALTLGTSGIAGMERLARLATTGQARGFVAAVLVLTALAAAAALWYRRRLPAPRYATPWRTAWQRARELGWRTVMSAAALTTVSMAARTAILPVLVAARPGIDPGAVLLGSFALLYGQLFLPTPAGAGGVELGFVGGFAGAMSGGELAALLLAWRLYTLILGAALGTLLFARASLARSPTSRPYSASSSVNVRSQL